MGIVLLDHHIISANEEQKEYLRMHANYIYIYIGGI